MNTAQKITILTVFLIIVGFSLINTYSIKMTLLGFCITLISSAFYAFVIVHLIERSLFSCTCALISLGFTVYAAVVLSFGVFHPLFGSAAFSLKDVMLSMLNAIVMTTLAISFLFSSLQKFYGFKIHD